MSSEESVTETQLWSEERLQSALADCALLKAEGNTYFSQKNWQNAIVAYQQALDALPPPPSADRKGKNRATEDGSEGGEGDEEQETGFTAKENSQPENEIGEVESVSDQPLTPSQKECSAARVVLLSNMAQCHIKLVRLSGLPPLLWCSDPAVLLGRMAEGRRFVYKSLAGGPTPPEVTVEEGQGQ